jgi:hypothetical protein
MGLGRIGKSFSYAEMPPQSCDKLREIKYFPCDMVWHARVGSLKAN